MGTLVVTLMLVTPARLLRMAECCANVLINVRDPESEVHLLQGARLGFYTQMGFYGARPQYKYVMSTVMYIKSIRIVHVMRSFMCLTCLTCAVLKCKLSYEDV